MAQQGRQDPRALAGEVDRLSRNCSDRGSDRQFPLAARWDDARTSVEFLYRNHQLICDASDLDAVLAAFDEIGQERPTATDGPVGLKVLDIGDRDAADIVDALMEVLEYDDMVTPNHVLNSQAFSRLCPATEPLPWRGPVDDVAEPVGQGRPSTAVVDTGFSSSVAQASAYARFSAVDSNSEPDDEIYAGTNDIRPYGGHGTASTSRLLSVSGAGSMSVRVRDSLVGGAVDELTIVDDLEVVVTGGVDIVSIQAGMYTRAGRAPKAFDAFYRRVLRKHPGTVLVVAAGNEGSDRPFWPAAYDWCTAVGALTHGGDARAGWTNYGYWVDLYASGENIVVPFPNGTYTYLDGLSADFTHGHAIWSGTSFAAPVVAGMIARRMIERNISAPDARDVVLAEAAVAALPATGPRVLV
jgi:Subtilase family